MKTCCWLFYFAYSKIMPVVTQQPGLPSTLLIQCMCLLTCLSRFVVFNQLVANRRMCIDIQQLDVQGTRLRFYIYYNVVFPLKMANSFGMSVPITISTNSRPINNATCRFGFSTVQRRNGILKKTLSRIYAN